MTESVQKLKTTYHESELISSKPLKMLSPEQAHKLKGCFCTRLQIKVTDRRTPFVVVHKGLCLREARRVMPWVADVPN